MSQTALNRIPLAQRLVHAERRVLFHGFANHNGGHTCYGLVRRHIVEHHTASANLGALADFHTTQDLGSRTDQNA